MPSLLASDIPHYVRCSYSSGTHCQWAWIERYITRGGILCNAVTGEPPDLEPDFQRGHVWTEEQQRAWVEYRLSGGWGADMILLNRYPDDSVVLVDGLQRLTAARRFVRDELRVFSGLVNASGDSPPGGWLCSEIDERVMHAVSRGAHLQIVVNTLQTRAEVLRWYVQLNAGGTPHSAEEIERVRPLIAAAAGTQ